MARTPLTGSRIRQRRLDVGMRQVALARAVGVSGSYLNLIEHNRRRIGGKLLQDIAETLGVDVDLLAEGGSARLLAALEAIPAPNSDEPVQELATRFPGWAERLVAQQNRIAELERLISGLNDRLTHDPVLSEKMHDVLSTVSAIRATSSILIETPDIAPDWRARFHTNIDTESRRLAETAAAMAAHFDQLGREDRGYATPLEAMQAYFEARGFVVTELEDQGAEVIEALLSEADEITTPEARNQLGTQLHIYAEIAARLPLDAFLTEAQSHAFDPAALARAFKTDIRTIFRRFAHLPTRPDLPEIGFVECDAAGGLLLRRPAPGFAMPRFGAACPLWPLFSALSQPGRPLHARLTTALGRPFDAYALAEAGPVTDFGAQPVLTSTMLLIGQPDETSQDAISVGASCRVCSEISCPARRESSILQASTSQERFDST